MKLLKITILAMCFLFQIPAKAQSLINENFESWIDNSAFIDPEGWVTFNELSPEYGIPFTVFKSTDANEGSYAAHMQTYTFVDGNNNQDTLPGIMVYGTDIGSGIPYPSTQRLKTISFVYKYKPNGVDTGVMYLSVGYRDKVTKKIVDQGGAYFIFSKKTETYTRVNLPLYYSTNHKCDTFVFAFINSFEKQNGNRPKPGTILIIDDIDTEWEAFPPMLNFTEPELKAKVYPNPATGTIHVYGIGEGIQTYRICDMHGRVVIETSTDMQELNVETLKPGLYHLSITSQNGSEMQSVYFHKQ